MTTKVYPFLLCLFLHNTLTSAKKIDCPLHYFPISASTFSSDEAYHANQNFDNTFMESPQKEDEVTSGYIQFGIMENRISNDSKEMLNRFGKALTSKALGKAVIKGHGSGDKYINDLVIERVAMIIDYLVQQQHIQPSRISSIIEEKGDSDIVNFEISDNLNAEH